MKSFFLHRHTLNHLSRTGKLTSLKQPTARTMREVFPLFWVASLALCLLRNLWTFQMERGHTGRYRHGQGIILDAKLPSKNLA